MTIDMDNPVLRLCQEGMRAEADGRPGDAEALFERAWDARTGDYDACVAAHYVARRQTEPAEILRWNRRALAHADAVGDETVASFYPSLHVSVALAHETLGDPAAARAAWAKAAEHVADLPADTYGEEIRDAITGALKRLPR
ncbi:MAG TPA: hypothetical protein VN408_17550 [Actinoplanes sp.]|nr:hypothetical protein [Actinoplanes sp.]